MVFLSEVHTMPLEMETGPNIFCALRCLSSMYTAPTQHISTWTHDPLQSVTLSVALGLIDVHRASPKSARRITFAVVEAIAFDLLEGVALHHVLHLARVKRS